MTIIRRPLCTNDGLQTIEPVDMKKAAGNTCEVHGCEAARCRTRSEYSPPRRPSPMRSKTVSRPMARATSPRRRSCGNSRPTRATRRRRTISASSTTWARGVTRSDAKALEWFHKSADQGYARAQFNLGRKYDNGEGTERDPVTAYMWFLLAAAGGSKPFAHTRNKIAKTLTPEQRERAKARARAWLEKRAE